MELRERWPIIDRLCECAAEFPELELWAFGSMLRTERPSDLDILIVYSDRADVEALREMELWEVDIPPVDIIAMTPDEVACYHFVEITRAVLLAPGRTGWGEKDEGSRLEPLSSCEVATPVDFGGDAHEGYPQENDAIASEVAMGLGPGKRRTVAQTLWGGRLRPDWPDSLLGGVRVEEPSVAVAALTMMSSTTASTANVPSRGPGREATPSSAVGAPGILTEWMTAHLRIVAVPVPDADALGRIEAAVLNELDPLLNLSGRPASDIRESLRKSRRAAFRRQTAK